MAVAGRAPLGACDRCGTHGAIPIGEDRYLCRGCNHSWRDTPSTVDYSDVDDTEGGGSA